MNVIIGQQYIDSLKLLGVAVAPGLGISIFVFYKDKFEKEPLHLLIKCFILGALAIIPAILINKTLQLFMDTPTTVLGVATFAFFVIGLSEEFSKFAVLRYFAFPKLDFNEPYDGITYSVMISMGFATMENVMYVFVQNTFPDSFNVALIRMFTAVPAHAAMGIMMGYFVGLAKFRVERRLLLLKGLIAAMLFHGIYDFLLAMQNYPFMTAGAIVSLFISIQLSMKAIKVHEDDSPFRT